MARYIASPFEQAYPVYAALGVALGICGGLTCIGMIVGWIAIGLGLLYVAYIFWEMRDMSRVKRWPIDWLWILMIFFGVGIISGGLSRPKTYPFHYSGDKLVYGCIEEKSIENSGVRLNVDVRGVYDSISNYKPLSNIKARILTDAVDLMPGDMVLFDNSLTPIKEVKFPGSSAYINHMINKGILYSASFLKDDQIRTVGHEFSLRERFNSFRDDINIMIDHSPLSRNAKGFISAMLIGVKDDLSPETRETFSRAGIAHILSVSGMHVGIVSASLWYLLIPLSLVVSRKKRMILVLVGVWIYTLMCGMSPPVLRAAVMSSFLIAAALLERIGKGFSGLCTSIIVILLFDPLAIKDAGFQMSISTVGALILFMRPLQHLYEGQHGVWRYLFSLGLTSIIAIIGSWHISSYYFHTFPLFFLPLNMIVVPFLPIVLFVSFIALLLTGVGISADCFFSIINKAYSFLERIAEFAGTYYVDNLWIHWSGIVVYSVLIIIIGLAIYTKHRKFWTSISFSLCIASVCLMFLLPTDKPKDEISLGNTYGMLIVRTYLSGDYSTIYPKRSTYTIIKLPDKTRIAAIDCDKNKLQAIGRKKEDCDFALIGTQFDGTVDDIKAKFGNPIIIMSALLSKKREAELIRQCRIARIPNHVVRKSGAFILQCESVQ